jgi:hypothetical protein
MAIDCVGIRLYKDKLLRGEYAHYFKKDGLVKTGLKHDNDHFRIGSAMVNNS